MSVGEVEELVAEANAGEKDRLDEKIKRLEEQRRELVQEYEATREAIVEELRPLRRWVDNRKQPVMDDTGRVEERHRLEADLREARQRFRRERQELDREIAEVRNALRRLEESEAQVRELLE